ncbi:MAG: hypothetical protein JJT96_14695 [Opitutales bacterium]|nr:hypothetical protein [Opitutales bacterium]
MNPFSRRPAKSAVFAAFAAIAAVTPLVGDLPPIVYTTETELHTTIRLPTGERLLIADRASGLVRLAEIGGDGLPVWRTEPINTGLRDLDSGTIAPDGLLSRDFFAVTNRTSNRINRLSFHASEDLALRSSILSRETAGKRAVVAARIPELFGLGRLPGVYDLLAFDVWTFPGSAFGELSIREPLPAEFLPPVFFAPDLPSVEGAMRLASASAPAVTDGVLLRSEEANPGATTFQIAQVTETGLLSYDERIRPEGSLAVYGDLLPSGEPLIVFWQPGSPALHVKQWLPADFKFLVTPLFSGNLSFSLGHLVTVIYENAPALLAFDASFTEAALYVFNPAGTPVLAETLMAPAGSQFTGALAAAGVLAFLTGDADGHTTGALSYKASEGLPYIGATTLPPLPPLPRGASLLVYDGVPFIDNNVRLLVRRDAGVWTSAFAFSGGEMSVTTETFLSPEDGLGDPDTRLQGIPPDDFAGALTNQITDQVSFFSLTAPEGIVLPEARISPPPGTYNHAVSLSFESNGPGTLFYRLAGQTGWSAPGAIAPHIMESTTVYYTIVQPGEWVGPVNAATYTILTGPAGQDTNGDGLPDFVRLHLGLDPNGPHDTDGDGFSDLAEILAGTNPQDDSSFPVDGSGETDRASASWFTASAIAAEIAPLSRRPGGTAGFARSFPRSADPLAPLPTQIRAFDNLGSLLGRAPTTAPAAGDTLIVPAARLPHLRVDDGPLFFIFAAEGNFPIQSGVGDQQQGRELIAARPMIAEPPAPFVYNDFGLLGGFSNLGDEVDAWIDAARDFYYNLPRPLLTIAEMDYRETLAALLLEAFIGEKLYERGQHPQAALDPATDGFPSPFISLTPFRSQENPVPVAESSGDPEQTVIPTRAQLRALGSSPAPTMQAYDLHAAFEQIHGAVLNLPSAPIQTLVDVAQEIYRLSATAPLDGSLRSPLTALRRLIRYGDLAQTGYADRPTLPAGIVMDAGDGVAEALALAAPRALSAHFLRIPSGIVGDPFTPLPEVVGFLPSMDPANAVESGAIVSLTNSAGNPFPLPRAFNLPPGSIIEVNGLFVSGTPGGTFTLEVIPPVIVRHLALPPMIDSDDNLIPDSLQELFPGTPLDPFADLDGDGFTLLQEIIAGTNPFDPASSPDGDPLDLAPPVVTITPVNPSSIFEVSFQYPAIAAPHIGFRLYGSDDLDTFFDTGLEAIHEGDGNYSLTFNTGGDLPAFFTFRMFLR